MVQLIIVARCKPCRHRLNTLAIAGSNRPRHVKRAHAPPRLVPADYERWLGDEPDPHDLMRPFPAEPMQMWPISTRVNKPENDDSSIVEPINLSAA